MPTSASICCAKRSSSSPLARQLDASKSPRRSRGSRRAATTRSAASNAPSPFTPSRRLPARRNAIARTHGEVVKPGEEVEATITVANEGSTQRDRRRAAPAHRSGARRSAALRKDLARVARRRHRRNRHDRSVRAAQASRCARACARRTPDRSELRIGASVHTRELGETPLGEATWRVDSHPAFSPQSSDLRLESDEVLRPNQLADVAVRITNVGSDVAHNVRVRLYVSPEARLETVDGATREKSTLVFGEIGPGATAEARLGLRLLRSLAQEYPVTVDGVLTADAMLPVPLERLTIATTAEPDFSVGTLRSEPIDVVDVGETIEWTLHVRNGGDGPARRVQIFCAQPASLIYVPNSTTVNDVPMRDVGALSALASERGIVLNDVDPGVEATIRFRDVVHNGLPAGEAIMRTSRHVHYDGERDDEMPSNELKVRATPVFANAIPGLPFGLDGMVGPSFGGGSACSPKIASWSCRRQRRWRGNGETRADAASSARSIRRLWPRATASTLDGDARRRPRRRRGDVHRRAPRARAALLRRSALRRLGHASVCDARVLPRSDRRYARRRGRLDARDAARRDRSACSSSCACRVT